MRGTAFANVNLYAIDPRGIGASRADSAVSGFARDTGGLAVLNVNDLDGAADRIMRESANYYLISVADPPVGSGAPLRRARRACPSPRRDHPGPARRQGWPVARPQRRRVRNADACGRSTVAYGYQDNTLVTWRMLS